MTTEQLELLLEYIDAKIAYEFASRSNGFDCNPERKYMELLEEKLKETI